MGADRAEIVAAYPFTLDRFQLEAFDALDAGHHVVVAAPTGSGKTVVAEYGIETTLREGRRAFYTAPLKALSNQKFRDLGERYGAGQVGLLTGDNSIDGDAPVVVMTTEVLRNMIYARSPALERLGLVVLDEVHYLQDAYRGPVWEEVIVHLPAHVRLVCLSATVSNSGELAAWIQTVRGPTTPVVELRRPVRLHDRYLVGDRTNDRLHLLETFDGGRANPEAARLDASAVRHGRFSRHQRPARAAGAASSTRPVGSRPSTCWSSASCCRRSCSSSAATSATKPPERAWPLACGSRPAPSATASGRSSKPGSREWPTMTSPSSATGSSSPSSRPGSPPTTPAWSRRSRKPWRHASSKG